MKPEDVGPVLRRTVPAGSTDGQAQLLARIKEQVAERDEALWLEQEMQRQAARRRRIGFAAGAVVVVILVLAGLWLMPGDEQDEQDEMKPAPEGESQGAERPDGPPLLSGEDEEEQSP